MATGRIFVGTHMETPRRKRWNWRASKGRWEIARGPARGFRSLKMAIEQAIEHAPPKTPTDWNEVEYWGKDGIEYISRTRAF